jgi:hypothetical protein
VNRKTLIATIVALLAMPAVAVAASGPDVSVRIEGLKRNLLLPTVVHVHNGWITRYGAPKGECSAMSGQGALDVATHHRWIGTWTTQFGPEYEITSILGETHSFSSKYFWEIFADNVAASVGACELKLHPGEHLLFAAVPDAEAATDFPLGIRVLEKPVAGRRFKVRVVYYNAHGKAKPLAGATVRASGISAEPVPHSQTSAKTNSRGVATLTAQHLGLLEITASKRGYIRAAPKIKNVT